MHILQQSISGFPAFLLYFVVSLVLLGLFLAVYVRVTPYQEIPLIRQGNVAASISLSGAMLGFAIPLANSIRQAANLPDMVLWGVIALVVQILVFVAVRAIIPGLARDIPEGKVAQGVFLGSLSVVTGILNAVSMTY